MNHWRSQVGVGVAATLLASLLATSLVASALALSVTNADPSVTVPTGVATNVNLNYVWNGTVPADSLAPGTTFAVTLPAGYTWTAAPTLASSTNSISLSGPVASSLNGSVTETWTLISFGVTSGSWTLALTGGQVLTQLTSGAAPIVLSVGGGSNVVIATLTASGAVVTSGVVPVTVSPLSVPANGTSTIGLTFGTPTTTNCSSYQSFTVTTTAGAFIVTTLPVVTSPVSGQSVTVACTSFDSVANATLTLQAPTTPGQATITVSLLPVGSSPTPVIDSATVVTFTKVVPSQGRAIGPEHGKGARKVAFYATTGATPCAAAPATPTAGTPSFGFAILNTTGHSGLNVSVSLKGAAPNATYAVAVQQSPGTCGTTFTVRTNARGNGNGHQHLALLSGATQAWVTAIQTGGATLTNGSNMLVTRLAMLPIKGHGPGPHPGNRDNTPASGHGRGHEAPGT
ncbi:MAG: hypothetical protein ACP5VP_05015 [Candidatus Limnocylindrales bacterium]